jgi:hypothetical protein
VGAMHACIQAWLPLQCDSLSLIHGGQGKSLVPSSTRGSVSLSRGARRLSLTGARAKAFYTSLSHGGQGESHRCLLIHAEASSLSISLPLTTCMYTVQSPARCTLNGGHCIIKASGVLHPERGRRDRRPAKHVLTICGQLERTLRRPAGPCSAGALVRPTARREHGVDGDQRPGASTRPLVVST